MQPKVYLVNDHDIDPSLIDPDAIFVMTKLREAGFTSYLVGGSVRDLLIKKIPKDFDISTSARPEQVKQLFHRNCVLIGRRFRLAHVRFGHKIFEVATFRSGDNEDDLIVRDNQWGTEEEDVTRRDFTVNGLFYDPSNHSVIDYTGGWDDIHKNILRTIGDPLIRFKQDPVRMIRLLKFRARFGFHIDIATRQALMSCRNEIRKSSTARILEEILRMLESGASAPFFNLLAESKLLELLYPTLANTSDGKLAKEIYTYLASIDRVNNTLNRKPLDRAILTSALLFPLLEYEIKTEFLDKNNIPHIGDIIMLTTSLIKQFEGNAFSPFTRRISATMGFILSTQYRMTPLSGKQHHRTRIVRHKEFPLALTFLKIRAQVDKTLVDTYTSWKDSYKQQERQTNRTGHLPHPAPNHKNHETIVPAK